MASKVLIIYKLIDLYLWVFGYFLTVFEVILIQNLLLYYIMFYQEHIIRLNFNTYLDMKITFEKAFQLSKVDLTE